MNRSYAHFNLFFKKKTPTFRLALPHRVAAIRCAKALKQKEGNTGTMIALRDLMAWAGFGIV